MMGFTCVQNVIQKEVYIVRNYLKLEKVFEENQDALIKAMQTLNETPSKDGNLFSKELRDRMEKFGDMDVVEALKNPGFWKELCDHAGMTEEEFENIRNKRT